MNKSLFAVYSLICYLVFSLAFLGSVAFVGDLTPPGLSAGAMPPLQALIVDLGLIGLFGLQHSIMARAGFKRWWLRSVPEPIERSTYVLLSSLALLLLFWQWRPLPGIVWNVEQPLGHQLLGGLYWLGWLLVVVSTFAIDHFELMGLRQVYAHVRGARPSPPALKMPALYRLVRHPLMLGFLIAFWATPHMTVGHLLFALGMTGYIFIGLRYEERDLLRTFGTAYQAYRRRVPMLIPLPRHQEAGAQPLEAPSADSLDGTGTAPH